MQQLTHHCNSRLVYNLSLPVGSDSSPKWQPPIGQKAKVSNRCQPQLMKYRDLHKSMYILVVPPFGRHMTHMPIVEVADNS